MVRKRIYPNICVVIDQLFLMKVKILGNGIQKCRVTNCPVPCREANMTTIDYLYSIVYTYEKNDKSLSA
jgi:hypothetical protein